VCDGQTLEEGNRPVDPVDAADAPELRFGAAALPADGFVKIAES
jgi:hypothetical protein